MRHRWRSGLGTALAIVVLTLPLTACGLPPEFFFCLVSGDWQSAACSTDSVAPGAPGPPTGVAAGPWRFGSSVPAVEVTWTENLEPDLHHYNVFWSDRSRGPYEKLGGTLAPVVATFPFQHACGSFASCRQIDACTSYYVVTAVDDVNQESEYSKEASLTNAHCGAPSTPSGFEVSTGAGDGEIRVDWAAPGNTYDLAGYNVYRSREANGTFAKLDTVLLPNYHYLDKQLPSGTQFFYRVTAVDLAGNESPPATGSATTRRAKLVGTTGPNFTISLTHQDGTPVTTLAPATYDIEVSDLSSIHNFHLTGPGVDDKTDVGGQGTVIWTLTLASGSYHYQCDQHPGVMSGDFTVSSLTAAGVRPPPSPANDQTFGSVFAARPTAAQAPAARNPRVRAPRGTRPFQLTVSGRYSAGGAATASQGNLIGKGLVFKGSFALRSGATALRGTWRSRIDWRLRPSTRRGSANGVALATFSDRKVGRACLRFKETYVAKKRGGKFETRGTFTMLGGTARAAKRLGRGSYRVPTRTNRTVVFRGKARAANGGKRLPAACRVLLR
jgi:hypothetical protein